MSSYDLFKELSELDEDLLLAPRKPVSLRINLLLCVFAANLDNFVPNRKPVLSIVMFLVIYAALYGAVYWFINRKRKRKLIHEDAE